MRFNQFSGSRRVSLLIAAGFALLFFLLIAFIYKPFESLAQYEKIANQPASEGRVITRRASL